MKRAIGLIAATLLTASIYSQDYSSSSSTSNPDSTPDYRSRQSESGAPASSDSSVSAGYDRAPGLSGSNNSTGQSNGANIGNSQSEDQSLTTRDSDLSGNEYRGTLRRSEPDSSFNSELNSDTVSSSSSTSSGAPGTSVSGSSSSSDETTVKGSGTADGAFHQPAAPVREGSKSEGWSSSGTFSGAGPGSVSGSASSSDNSSGSSSLDSSSNSSSSNNSFDSSSSSSSRDEDLRSRGLEPDSNQLGQNNSNSDIQGDNNNDDVWIIEEWQLVRPDENVGAPAESESGTSSGSDVLNYEQQFTDRFDSSKSSSSGSSGSSISSGSDSYSNDLYGRVQKDWSARLGTDVPHSRVMDRTLEELENSRYYNDSSVSSFGAPGSSVSGSGSSKSDDKNCDEMKKDSLNSGGPGSSVSGSSSSEDREQYRINRGEDEKYHINRDASGDKSSSDTSAPSDYGDRPSSSSYDDGHLNGNNAIGSSGSYDSSSSAKDISRPDSEKSSPSRPQGGDENSATTPD